MLFLILLPMAMQGTSELLLEVRHQLPELRRESYFVHSQIVVGVLIFLLIIFGRLLIKF